MVRSVFYRSQGAYLVGRVRSGPGGALDAMPLTLALHNCNGRLAVDAVLLTADEVSILFSFTRSYFHVEVDRPHDLVAFLHSIMPRKPIAELYIAIGFNKHGKTELFRDLIRHIHQSSDRFQIARGDPGMVMTVFTLPSFDVVFKVIRDTFAYPKTTTRRQVVDRYQLVYKHDRAGRLADVQEFEHLAFARGRFSDDLLAELAREAPSTVTIGERTVEIKHVYTERRMTPLNLYLREVDCKQAREAVIDYGQAVKDLAATNIFPGDMLLKNFGVTRHGRVVFYDYDELCLVTDCNVRELPPPRDFDDEVAAEPWFHVSPTDVFPEEFVAFMGLSGELREAFLKAHGDLLTARYWCEIQARHRAGELIDIVPYRLSRRLSSPGEQ
jgi:isocitrate dehydrogenase kinase/phosphatase